MQIKKKNEPFLVLERAASKPVDFLPQFVRPSIATSSASATTTAAAAAAKATTTTTAAAVAL